jgi:hypothetical protein
LKFEDDTFDEANNRYIVQADWFQAQIKRFFEEKKSVILVPTERSEDMIHKREFSLEIDKLLDAPGTHRVQSQERLAFGMNKTLLEIFNWYALKFLNDRPRDFDALQQNLHLLNMQGFACFCKEFRVPLDNRSVAEVYKRSQVNNQPF